MTKSIVVHPNNLGKIDQFILKEERSRRKNGLHTINNDIGINGIPVIIDENVPKC